MNIQFGDYANFTKCNGHEPFNATHSNKTIFYPQYVDYMRR
jgi:hypothetical protein